MRNADCRLGGREKFGLWWQSEEATPLSHAREIVRDVECSRNLTLLATSKAIR